MSKWGPSWALRVLWRLGAGWALMTPVALLLLTLLLRAVKGPSWQMASEFYGGAVLTMLVFTWGGGIAVRHVRVAVSARELRMPGFPRAPILSVCALAAGTVLMICALSLLWGGMMLHWAELSVCAITLGCLFALTDSWPLLMLFWVLMQASLYTGIDWFTAMGSVLRAQLGLVAGGMLLTVVWRAWSVGRALRYGSAPGFLGRRDYVDGPAGRHRWARPYPGPGVSQRHSLPAAMRIVLGPLYDLHPGCVPLWLAPVPIMLLSGWAQRMILDAGAMLPADLAKSLAATFIPTIGCWWLFARAQRLSALLYEPQGETVELALLPGLGSVRQQRAALLMQALVRPLLYAGLCLAGVVGSYWAVLHISRAPPALLLNVAMPAAMVLMLFASLTLGVAGGRLAPTNDWLKGLSFIVLLPASCNPMRGPPVSTDTAELGLLWLGLNVVTLGGMAACMISDVLHLRRRPRLLCQ